MHRSLVWPAAGWAGFLLLPWYALEDGYWAFGWLADPFGSEAASALIQAGAHGRWWLAPLGVALIAGTLGVRAADARARAWALILGGALGLGWMVLQGVGVGARGLTTPWLRELAPDFEGRQFGMGYGALLTALALLAMLSEGLARRGSFRGDAFVLGSVLLVIGSTLVFVFWPVALVLVGAAVTDVGFSALAFVERIAAPDIWTLRCFAGGGRCGVMWHTAFLAIVVGVLTTALGLCFALLAERTQFPFKRALRMFAVLPVITPPFVIGLAVILLFGQQGAVTVLLETVLGIPRSRWIYGWEGIALAQVLSFTPVAFLILIGVVQGVSPSMEEAAQTLRASRWRTFRTVTFPLIRPGLANAFLVTVLESISDFGNPAVLGGNFDVLSTQIFFALVGAQSDAGRAAALAIVLLAMSISVFVAQGAWLGQRAYTTVGGKGDAGLALTLPAGLHRGVLAVTMPWVVFTAVVYGMILAGGMVETLGRDHTLTFRHFTSMFGIEQGPQGLVLVGGAWKSFFTTMETALIAAPLTAALGLLTAWILVRQDFPGRASFEFITMLSFAIPGTVIGIAYVMAFNTPPIEITGTAIILIVCFVFRDMPVGIRAGVAALRQVDKSLEESSLMLRHGSFATLRRVVLPLIRPAIVAALVFAIVRAMTSISAVVFLATTRHNLATNYIIGRVEIADYGGAIAYSAVLVLVMAALIALIQLAVGERRLGRRAPVVVSRSGI
jgi:iron(III) transport system permease protein